MGHGIQSWWIRSSRLCQDANECEGQREVAMRVWRVGAIRGVGRVYLPASCATPAAIQQRPAHPARRDWRRCLTRSRIGKRQFEEKGESRRRCSARICIRRMRWYCKRTWCPIRAKTPNLVPNGRRQWQCRVAPHDGEDQENLGTGGHPRPLGRGRPSAGGAALHGYASTLSPALH